jgi:hypothetical protein
MTSSGHYAMPTSDNRPQLLIDTIVAVALAARHPMYQTTGALVVAGLDNRQEEIRP